MRITLLIALYISGVKLKLISIIFHFYKQFLGLSKNDQTYKFAENKVNIQNQLNVYILATSNKNNNNDIIYDQTIPVPNEYFHDPREGKCILNKTLKP